MAAPALPSLSASAAVRQLSAGGLVVHATNSLLGIGADPTQADAIAKLNALKGRDPGRGYVHVVDCAEHAKGWIAGAAWRQWLRVGLPSPVTWVLPAGPNVPHAVRGPDDTVAIRLDTHPCVAALCAGLGRPIVSTSLNAPGETPLHDVNLIPSALTAQLDGVFVMRPPPLGQPSTVVLMIDGDLRVLRRGAVAVDELRAALDDGT